MIRIPFSLKLPITSTLIITGKITAGTTRFLSSRPTFAEEEDEVAARKWLANYNPDTIPQKICDVSFSRSSGPGGQNVNK